MLGLAALLALGMIGSASAVSLLFIPHSGHFPYHFAGAGGAQKLITVNDAEIEAKKVDVLALILSSTLADVHLRFLETKTVLPIAGVPCNSAGGGTETILINLIAHLGLAHNGVTGNQVPAALFLIPNGFEFECEVEKLKLRGAVVGQIVLPALNVASELLRFRFKQKNGVQELSAILFGEELDSGNVLELLMNGKFEQAAQEGEFDLKALPGEGTFLLVSP